MICLLSVYISIFATNHVIQVPIPKENHLPHEKNQSLENTTIKFNYTGLSGKTFRENLYRKFFFHCLLSDPKAVLSLYSIGLKNWLQTY